MSDTRERYIPEWYALYGSTTSRDLIRTAQHLALAIMACKQSTDDSDEGLKQDALTVLLTIKQSCLRRSFVLWIALLLHVSAMVSG